MTLVRVIPLDKCGTKSRKKSLIQILDEEYTAGKSLVPLIGAGLSAPSGIPTASELEKYLSLCVSMALGVDEHTKKMAMRWHPKLNGWPAMRGDWLSRAATVDHKIEALLQQRRKDQQWGEYRILRESFGDVADWRLALLFLSRLSIPQHNDAIPRIRLIDSDSHIIDSFFNHITRNKTPSMGHHILARIADSLRARVTLTLNFDNLLEQAYEEFGLKPFVFEVHHAAGLPPWSLLGKSHSVIKLHGGKYGIRADFTLDREPTEIERRHFRGYLLGRDWTADDDRLLLKSPSLKPQARANLILAGVSGQDLRVVLFIKDALKHLRTLKVFWLCRSDRAKKEASEACQREITDNLSSIAIVQSPHISTALWEIYQRLMRSVPSGGLEFPASWQIPLVPEPTASENKTAGTSAQAKAATKWLKGHGTNSPLVLESGSNRMIESGVSSFAWNLFQRSLGSHSAIWLDGEDLWGVDDLRERLFHAVCSQIGQNHQLPPLQRISSDEYFDDLESRLTKSGRPWVLFLNLRGYLGYSADMFFRLTGKEPKDWSTDASMEKDVEDFLTQLFSSKLNTMRLVVLKRDCNFRAISESSDAVLNFNKQTPRRIVKSWATRRVEAAIKWADSDPETRWRILRAIAVFPLVRHHTALVARSIVRLEFEESWADAWQKIDAAIQTLTKKKILRKKSGGFLWLHWEIRNELRKIFAANTIDHHTNENDRLDIHIGLADWSMTLFRATHDPLAAFQAIFHRCRVAQFARARAADNLENRAEDLVRVRSTLCEGLNHLEEARASILAWGNSLDAQRCLDGVFKLLVDIANTRNLHDLEQKRNRRFLLMAGSRMLLYKIWLYRDLGDCNNVIQVCKDLRQFLENPFDLGNQAAIEYKHDWPTEYFLVIQQCRLEEAIVCISLRNYFEARARFEKMVTDFGLPLNEITTARNDKAVEMAMISWADSDIGSVPGTFRYERRRLIFIVLRRLIETLLLEHESRALLWLCKADNGLSTPTPALLELAQRLYIAARMLPRFVTEDEYSPLRIERSRLHCVFAGVLACKGDLQGVQRHLNEAWSNASHIPESEESIAKCVVELRRVYCLLHSLTKLEKLLPFVHWMMKNCATPCDPMQLDRDDLVRIASILDDARVILDRIESRMNRNRKSLWWWMTMRRYQIVILQYEELLRLIKRSSHVRGDVSSNLDSLNIATCEGGETGRLLLLETSRRVSADLFQMARIAHNGLNLARMTFMSDFKSEARWFDANWSDSKIAWRNCLENVANRIEELAGRFQSEKDEWILSDPIRRYVEHVRMLLRDFNSRG